MQKNLVLTWFSLFCGLINVINFEILGELDLEEAYCSKYIEYKTIYSQNNEDVKILRLVFDF